MRSGANGPKCYITSGLIFSQYCENTDLQGLPNGKAFAIGLVQFGGDAALNSYGLRATTRTEMKFRTLVALVAFAAFTGSVQAHHSLLAPQSTESQEIDPRLLDQIVEAVSCQTGMSCCEVREAFYEGEMEIEKTADGYVVRVASTNGGGILDIVIEDEL